MSLNQFSPEVLMRIFSHLLDVGSKIRLERVNKRFRDCIRNVESWKYNTKLTMTHLMSDEQLRSFLSHTKVVTQLILCGPGLTSKSMSTLFTFSDKLKITYLCYEKASNNNCEKYQLVVASCLGKFVNKLKKVTMICCGNADCSVHDALAASLPLCGHLTDATLYGFNEGNIEGNNTPLLGSLVNMSLNTITLFNFNSTINGEHLAAVCNSAKDHSLSAIRLCRFLDVPPASMRFELAQFCESLEPAAAQAIKFINLNYVECGWVELLPTLLAVFPNLVRLILDDCPRNATLEDAVKIAQALGGFLHGGAQHKKPVGLKLEITCKEEDRAFGGWLWDSVDLIEVRRSGTKRTVDMEHWKRTLVHGNVSVSIGVG